MTLNPATIVSPVSQTDRFLRSTMRRI